MGQPKPSAEPVPPGPAPKPVEAPKAMGAGDSHRGVACISSHNGMKAVARAMELMKQGYDPADCIVQGVRIVEDDPNDDSVGFGGLPNEDGVVQLDASVMHGPTHKSGAVGALERIRNPAMVALLVLRRTDHCLLIGEGALRFAKAHGFQEQDLLTEHARKEWMRWKENRSKDDDWLNDDERDAPVGKTWDELPGPRADAIPLRPTPRGRNYVTEVTGTIHCSIVTEKADIASCTTTSGLNWKIPGRLGDSPIIGAGNYCDNDIGAGGCTGRGEAAIVNLAGFRIVDLMGRGMSPTEACLAVAKQVVDHNKEKRNRTDKGLPNFNIDFYALRKDGAHGGACIYKGRKFAVHDGSQAKLVEEAYLYEKM